MKIEYKNFAINTFIDLAKVYGPSGREGKISQVIKNITQTMGILWGPKGANINFDRANTKFVQHGFLPGDIGNLFIDIPPTPGYEHLPCLGFNAHLDTVEPAKNIVPKINKTQTRITSKGETILGADDRAGIAVILTMLKILHNEQIPHGPLQIILTVSEERRLLGSRYVNPDFIKAKMIFSFDGEDPAELLLGACSSDKYQISIRGKNAHAGVHPEQGISAPLILAKAITYLNKVGYWGKISPNKNHLASVNLNIAGFQDVGTNNVQAELKIIGEARSFNKNLLRQITAAIKRYFLQAAKKTKSASGETASIKLTSDRAYNSFRLTKRSEITKRAKAALEQNGLAPKLTDRVMGGLDACWLNQYAPTIVIGMGAHNYHQTNEYLNIPEFLSACQIAVSLAGAK